MVTLNLYDILQIVFGGLFFWFGVYLVSRNPTSKLSWLVFAFLAGFACVIGTNPILLKTRSIEEYLFWQKATDWSIFFPSIFSYHVALLAKASKSKLEKYLLLIGYLGAAFFTIIDIKGGLILQETVLRYENYRRFDGFSPGVLLVPFAIFEVTYLLMTARIFFGESRNKSAKYLLPGVSSLVIASAAIFATASFYARIENADVIFTLIMGIGLLPFIFSTVKYQLFSASGQTIFDRTFLYRTIAVVVTSGLYLSLFALFKIPITFEIFALIVFLMALIIVSHSFYDWLITFINDLVYNSSKGFSLVTDQEVYEALRNYRHPQNIEESSLLRLRYIQRKISSTSKLDPVQALQSMIAEAINFFESKLEPDRRTKANLKFNILKMILDESEEGQILWELGFDEYPVSIMSRETKSRPPKFKEFSPADYFYTSRNAYLALKREAIHDVAWRISYLEKHYR